MLDFGYYNMDCMQGMKEFPDKYFDLAIVDPPYGIGVGSMAYTNGVQVVGKALAKRRDYSGHSEWDKAIPEKAYFDELFRVSRNQVIWGGNYFTDYLKPSKSWIVWDKRCEEKYRDSFADCELAWTNKGVARVFRFLYKGMLQENMSNKEQRFHPTQKPVALYKWILDNYAKPGDKILDTHVGSASSLIACEDFGFQYVGFEIDEDYYRLGQERLERNRAQITISDLITDWRFP